LLAYAVVRAEIDSADAKEPESDTEELPPETRLLQEFLKGNMMLTLEETAKSFRNETTRKEILAECKKYKESLKDNFKKHRIGFSDWKDFRECFAAASRELFNERPNVDDPMDERAKDIAATVLAMGENKEARDYLVKRCAADPDLLALTLIAGDAMKEGLKVESSNKDSFISDEGKGFLRLLELKPLLLAFAKEDPSFRVPHKADLPEDQKGLLDGQPYNFFLDEESTILLKLAALGRSAIDPSSINVINVSDDDGTALALISGYSARKKKFVCRGVAWTSAGYKQLTLGQKAEQDLITQLPAGSKAVYDSDRKELRIAIDRYQKVKKSRSEQDYRLVTKYRTENRYDPYLNGGYGGTKEVLVPYEEYEPYERTVGYEEPERGSEWRVYTWDPDTSSLGYSRKLWVQDLASFEEADKKARSSSSSKQVSKQSLTAATAGTDADAVDSLTLAALSRELTREELDKLSKKELKLVRNGIFARRGYSFRDPSLRRYFQKRSWYRASTSNMEAVAGTLTDSQRATVDLIKGMEGER
ncbi:YARHG domain-containing protein, partial [bacterium]